jgi:hypothetical protein
MVLFRVALLLPKPCWEGAWGQKIAFHLPASADYNYKYSCVQVEDWTSCLLIRPFCCYGFRRSAPNVCLGNYWWTEVSTVLCELRLFNEFVIAMLYEPCLLETQEHVVVLTLHETPPKTTYVKVVNAFGHVLGDNTWKGRVLLQVFIAVFLYLISFHMNLFLPHVSCCKVIDTAGLAVYWTINYFFLPSSWLR